MYRGSEAVIRAAEVAPQCLLGSLVVEEKNEHKLESGANVAKQWKIS